jgi:predicted O-methyltransferase YrrM
MKKIYLNKKMEKKSIYFLNKIEVIIKIIRRSFIRIIYIITGANKYKQEFYQENLINSLEGSLMKSDISDHLSNIFYHSMEVKPRLIVELGTRGGESTRVLLSVAAINNCKLLSIDIDDCSKIKMKDYQKFWNFIKADDIYFGKNKFIKWCQNNNIEPKADVIFIDTSHEYEHTLNEIMVWKRHLSRKGTMIFHDTNSGNGVYKHLDGTIGFGSQRKRDVIKALEDYFSVKYDESSFFTDFRNDMLIKHYPYCNGLTVVKRIG